jgi:hypothetical protein
MTRLLAGFVWSLLSLMPAIAFAQDINTLKSGVVRIRNTSTQDVGTGFIIRIDGERAYIITASHVVKDNEHPSVYLYNRQNEAVQATLAYREADEQKGLALLEIKSNKETFAGLVPVGLRVSSDLKGGEQVQVIGFPDGVTIWSVAPGNISRLEARNLVFSAPVRTGNSGSPVFFNGLVVGLVTDADPSSAYAVRAEGIFEYLSGINAKLAEFIKPRPPAEVGVPSDKSEFCRALSRIVDSSREGFYDIVKEGYESAVIIPGFKSATVSPEIKRASFFNFISDYSKALNQYYELVANTKRCLTDWKRIENTGSRQSQLSVIDAPKTFLFYRRDGTVVSVKRTKVADEYMVDLTIYAAESGMQSFETRDHQTALALIFTETEADKDSVCHDLKALVNASHEGFASIVGKPGSSSGYFESSIKIAGFPAISVRRREQASVTFDAESLNEVEALNYRLIGILSKCFPSWAKGDVEPKSDFDRTTRYFRLTEEGDAGSVLELRYDSARDAKSHRLYLNLYSRSAAPRLR